MLLLLTTYSPINQGINAARSAADGWGYWMLPVIATAIYTTLIIH